MESTASSGRSTPAMLNGHGGSSVALGGSSTAAGGKCLSYTCCWDHCQLHFPSSPDLAEHIRTTHVDGQRGGVSVLVSAHCRIHFIQDGEGITSSCTTGLLKKSKMCSYTLLSVKVLNSTCVCVSYRCLCVCGRAVRCTTHHPPVRAGCRDTCWPTVETSHSR